MKEINKRKKKWTKDRMHDEKKEKWEFENPLPRIEPRPLRHNASIITTKPTDLILFPAYDVTVQT